MVTATGPSSSPIAFPTITAAITLMATVQLLLFGGNDWTPVHSTNVLIPDLTPLCPASAVPQEVPTR